MIAQLGPGAVVGTELLKPGTTSLFKVKVISPCLLWSLSREAYQTYLTVGLFGRSEDSWTQSSKRLGFSTTR